MFGTEPLERPTQEEVADFEKHACARLKRCVRRFYWAGSALALNIALIVPFLAGHSLHRYWDLGKYLIFTAEAFLVWFMIASALVWASWQSSRETRREYGLD